MELEKDAAYRESSAYADNPLILALPEQKSPQELFEALNMDFELPSNYESLPPQVRQELCFKIKELYIPLEYAADIYASFYFGLVTAYTGRTKLEITKRMSQLGEVMEYRQFRTLPDSPFQAEGFSILGEPGMGKTTTVKKILQLFPQVIKHTKFGGTEYKQVQITYLMIECPLNHSQKSVCFQILQKFDEILGTDFVGEALRSATNIDVMVTRIAQLCVRFCVGSIIIDEIQNVLHLTNTSAVAGRKNTLIKFFVELANKTGACLIYVGTPAVSDFFNSEPHLARRTRGPRIPLLNEGHTYHVILEKMWNNLALLDPAPLNGEIEKEVYANTGGCIAKMASLLHYAAFEAIFFGRERIEAEDIRNAARKHDIAPKRPTQAPSDLRQFNLSKRTPIKKVEGKVLAKRKGRPKISREREDLLEAYAVCEKFGLDFIDKVKGFSLLYSAKEV